MNHSYFNINEEKCSIRCKLYYEDLSSISTVILSGTGFGGHKDNKATERFAKRALEKNKGIAVMTFNWPCHGDDVRKTLHLEDCMTYMKLVVSHIQDRFGDADLYAYATSFGGYLFLKYISEAENPFLKMALRCPAVNMHDVLTAHIMTTDNMDVIRKGKPAQVGFDRKISLRRELLEELAREDIRERDFSMYKEDILILHGTNDEIAPFEETRKFAEKNQLQFIPVEGADHRFMDPQKMNHAIEQSLHYFGLH